jgi:hypothetical protein
MPGMTGLFLALALGKNTPAQQPSTGNIRAQG